MTIKEAVYFVENTSLDNLDAVDDADIFDAFAALFGREPNDDEVSSGCLGICKRELAKV